MHPGREVLGGPVFWFIVGLLFLAGMLAAFVLLDSWRAKRRARMADLPEPWWLYPAAEVIYLALLFIVQTPVVPAVWSAVLVLITPVAIGVGVAYLLRVVFPKPTEDAAWNEADAIEFAEGLGQVPPREGGPQPLEGSQED